VGNANVQAWWLDAQDALRAIDRSCVADYVKEIARCLHLDGIAVIRRAHSKELCDSVVADFKRYVADNRRYVSENLDSLGREKRLVNFHLISDAAARIGCAEKVMSVLDFIFEGEASVYSSLTFKFGTQQPVHRDTPHFATWPKKMFVGVWTALEDVDDRSGPLFYHRGGHRFEIDPLGFMGQAKIRLPEAPLEQRLLLALDLYNGEVIRRAPTVSPASKLEMKAGDTVIWHPELPHGGSPAIDTARTRWSIVFHCAPRAVQVHQHDRFFTHDSPEAPPDRYVYRSFGSRSFAESGAVSFM
jgi:ectoine hydroxylase-related dioxygenase (phytanoyl-CoA dioxygenase family)